MGKKSPSFLLQRRGGGRAEGRGKWKREERASPASPSAGRLHYSLFPLLVHTLHCPSSSSTHSRHLPKPDSPACPLLSPSSASLPLPPATRTNFLLLSSWKALPNPSAGLKAADRTVTHGHPTRVSSGSCLSSHTLRHEERGQPCPGSTAGKMPPQHCQGSAAHLNFPPPNHHDEGKAPNSEQTHVLQALLYTTRR